MSRRTWLQDPHDAPADRSRIGFVRPSREMGHAVTCGDTRRHRRMAHPSPAHPPLANAMAGHYLHGRQRVGRGGKRYAKVRPPTSLTCQRAAACRTAEARTNIVRASTLCTSLAGERFKIRPFFAKKKKPRPERKRGLPTLHRPRPDGVHFSHFLKLLLPADAASATPCRRGRAGRG
jgi:hypothetical protein